MLLNVRKWLGEVIVEVSVPGTAYDFAGSLEMGVPLDAEEIGKDAEITIRNMILRSFATDLKYRNQANVNSVRLTVVCSNNRQLYYTLGATLLAIAAGTLFKLFLPETVSRMLNDDLFAPIKATAIDEMTVAFSCARLDSKAAFGAEAGR